jgi:hypothetical protein
MNTLTPIRLSYTLAAVAVLISAAAVHADPAPATIHVRSTGGAADISEVTEHSEAHATYGGATGDAYGMAWRDVCVAPCTLQLSPGFHELRVGGGYNSSTLKINAAPGDNYVVANPGSDAKFYGGVLIASAGLLAVVFGAVDHGADNEAQSLISKRLSVPIMLGGVAGLGVGIGLSTMGHTSIDDERRTAPVAAEAPIGMNYHSKF